MPFSTKNSQRSDTKASIAVSLQSLINLQLSGAAIDLHHRKRVITQQSGGYLSKLRGRGVDFAEVRTYQPGDDIRSIDWRVTARTGRTHTKLYCEDRERPIFLVIDYSASMFFGTRVTFKSAIAAKAAALLAWSAAQQREKIGGMVFSGMQQQIIPPRGGKNGVLPLLKALSDTVQPPSSVQQATDFTYALSQASQLAKPGSMIIIISDFNSFDANAEIKLRELATRHDVMANFIYDSLEAEPPPPNRYAITDGNVITSIDTSFENFREKYRQHFLVRKHHLQTLFRKLRIPHVEMGTHENVTQILQNFFRAT